MQFLALLIALSLAADHSAQRFAPRLPDGGSTPPDLCELGRQIARLAPCTEPKGCEALQVWKELFGPPSPHFADPGDAAGFRPGWIATVDSELPERSFSYRERQIPYRELLRTRHCWATDRGSVEPARP